MTEHEKAKAIREYFLETRKVTRTERQVLREIERVQQEINGTRQTIKEQATEVNAHHLASLAEGLGRSEGRLRGLEFVLQWLEMEGLDLITGLPEGETK